MNGIVQRKKGRTCAKTTAMVNKKLVANNCIALFSGGLMATASFLERKLPMLIFQMVIRVFVE